MSAMLRGVFGARIHALQLSACTAALSSHAVEGAARRGFALKLKNKGSCKKRMRMLRKASINKHSAIQYRHGTGKRPVSSSLQIMRNIRQMLPYPFAKKSRN
eukprot:TRINITY_DN1548_c0_g1_i1.p4 TRINITY_DN1548_c0_g1~~TRINITY_DN1548_c0_g1_i1.p4  ORF type:complete len:102 (-),score=29.08 TRINITY_DN1548_c0_g1_i1:212-517(-)